VSIRNPQNAEERAIKRKQDRDRKRRIAARKVAERNRCATHCQFRIGKHGLCGGRLEDVVDRLGRLHVVCRRCERRKAGVCLDCPRKTQGMAWRCTDCTRKAERHYNARWVETHRERKNASVRAYRRRRSLREASERMEGVADVPCLSGARPAADLLAEPRQRKGMAQGPHGFVLEEHR
jgi:hypothetical protein